MGMVFMIGQMDICTKAISLKISDLAKVVFIILNKKCTVAFG